MGVILSLNILILEASTSSAKAMIYNSLSGPVKTRTIPYDESCSDVVSQDADQVFEYILKVGRELICDNPIDCISISCTWHNLLVVDQNLIPKTRAFTWAYTGAYAEAEELRRDTDWAIRHYHSTGGMVHAMYPLFKLIHLKKSGLQILPGDMIIDQGSYIFSKLTGDVAQSISNASGTGLLNIHTLDWDQNALEITETQKSNLPKLVDHTYTQPLLAQYAQLLGVREDIPVLSAHPDGALNQVGSGALKNGIMTLSVGTSGALRVAYDRPYMSDVPSLWCYFAPGKWLVGAATSGSTNCLEWFAGRVMANAYSLRQLDEMITRDDHDLPIFLPFLFGERSPGWDDKRLGGFKELKNTHTVGDLYGSILEGVLFNLFQCYEVLIKENAIPKAIKVSGGIVRSPVWLQMLADIFQKEMKVSDNEQASLLGAAGLGMLAMGEISHLEEFDNGQEFIIAPHPENREKYQRRYQRYLEFYHQNN